MAQIYKNTDVLVIGGGLAGCWAAIRAKAFVPKVLLIDKASVSRSGASSWANYILAPPPEKERDLWKKELVEKALYLSNQEWVDALLLEHGQRIQDMESWGVPFDRDAKGQLIVRKGRGHENTGFVVSEGKTRMEALKRKAQKLGVDILEKIMITDLLTSDGKLPTSGSITGAMGFQTKTGENVVIKSKSVIIASGPLYQASNNLSGDGLAMAFRSGAELMSMEFCTSAHQYTSEGKHLLGSVSVHFQSIGMKILNSKGERFMEKYEPVLKERSNSTIMCLALAKETLEGRGPAILDMSDVKEEDIKHYASLFPTTMAYYIEAGIDLKKDRLVVVNTINVSSSNGDGGIRVDTQGRTNIPGLYGAGSTCKNQVHGTYTVGGVNLAFCCTSGYRAGERAALDSLKAEDFPLNQQQVETLSHEALLPLKNKKGLLPSTLFKEIARITVPVMVSIIKRADRIKNTIEALESLEKKLNSLRARNYHELVKANELKNFILLSKLTFLSALEREESRHSHYRQDYPYRDDINWLKWILIKLKGEGQITISTAPVPFEQYKLKPERRLKIPSPIKFD